MQRVIIKRFYRKSKVVNGLSLLFLSAATAIFLSGCTQTMSSKAFSTVSPGKSLLHYSTFELVSDFNSDPLKNHYQKEWVTHVTSGAKVLLQPNPQDSLNSFGGSLSIVYEIPKAGSIHIASKLDGLDVSQAQFVIGKIQADQWNKYGGKVFLELADTNGNSRAVEIKPVVGESNLNHNQNWLEIEIPISLFKGLNLDVLDQFSLNLESQKAAISGALAFDELAFYGPEKLFFLSARDNLKGFPDETDPANANKVSGVSDDQLFLREIARDTWGYFDQVVDRKSNLVLDHVRNGREKGIGGYTSPTNIAFYWLSCVAASDLGFISREDAAVRIKESIQTLEKLALWENRFYYNFYRTNTLRPSSHFVSSVDNGWLIASLVIVRQAFPGQFDEFINRTFKAINFSEFYDQTNGQIRLGFDEDNATFTSSHYGLLASEARLISYVAIGKGDLPKEHWAHIYRTLPKEWTWQRKIPEGSEQKVLGSTIFEGFYRYGQRKFVPSWGGSLFEFLAPTLLVNEQMFGKTGLGMNNVTATELHIYYALEEKKYPAWGIAPAATPDGKHWSYHELGVKDLGAKGYPDEGIIAPYASALAIEIKPDEVIKNFRALLKSYPDIYGPYGFYDSVNVKRGKVNDQYLALDQGMILIALTNYLTGGAIRNRFHADPIGKSSEELLKAEQFFEEANAK